MKRETLSALVEPIKTLILRFAIQEMGEVVAICDHLICHSTKREGKAAMNEKCRTRAIGSRPSGAAARMGDQRMFPRIPANRLHHGCSGIFGGAA